MVPNDWNVYELNDLCHKISVGLAISVTPFMKSVGTKLIRNQNIKRNYFNSDSVVYIDNDFAESNKSKRVKSGDVVAVRTGSNIGEACVVPKDFDGALTFTTLIARPNPKLLDSYFLSTHMNSEIGISEVNRLCAGGGKPNLNSGELKHYRILTPSLLEQKKITQILSNWDQAISATEKLLENSQQQKKALMQQLLTGKKRLLDENGVKFSEEWKKGKLNDLVKIDSGFAFKSSDFTNSFDGVPIIRMSDFKNGGLDIREAAKVSKEITNSLQRFRLNSGDFVFGMSGSLSNYGWVKEKDLPCYLNQRVGRLVANEQGDQKFVTYLYLSEKVQQSIIDKAAGAAQLNISVNDLRGIQVFYPVKEEQQKIAKVLSLADQEIENLYKKIDCLKQEKKALMQQLLTGKKRVKVAA
ncbi:restriction endonuclease subunit S [Acinetobacter pseudolwoffii]|uniref:restriction endonuclease subunit S n=1 Tax=Acinetobacter pseudolwoffii TaxID=2053287 RepID=UPI003988F582